MRKTYYDQYGEARFRSPKEEVGFASMWHVLTLDCKLSDAAFRLYAVILKYAMQKGKAYMTVKTLAKDLCKGRRTIQYALRELEERGLITREERTGTTPFTWVEEINDLYRDELEALLRERGK